MIYLLAALLRADGGPSVAGAPLWVAILMALAALAGSSTITAVVVYALNGKARQASVDLDGAKAGEARANAANEITQSANGQFALLERYLESMDKARVALEEERKNRKKTESDLDDARGEIHALKLRLERFEEELAAANDRILALQRDLAIAQEERKLALEHAGKLGAQLDEAKGRITTLECQVAKLTAENERLRGAGDGSVALPGT